MPKTTLPSLDSVLPAQQVLLKPAEIVTYEIDAGLDRGRPDGVVFPRTAADVLNLVRWAARHGIALIARGAGTGLSGGAVAEQGGVVVQFSQMRAILAIDTAGRSATVEPGAVNQELDKAVRALGLYYPPDPSSGRSSTLGGNIAENSGGPHCFKYGVTTNYVTGLEIVLADGSQIRLGGQALDYPEYDLTGLVVGSEGTLAIVTRAELRLVRNPPAVATLMAAFDSVEQAGVAVSAIIARGLVPSTLEMMDQKIMRIIEDYTHGGLPVDAGAGLIVESDGFAASVEPQIAEIAAILREYGVREVRIAASAEQRDLIWYGRKSAAGAMARLSPAYYLVDVTVPRSKLAPALAQINQICDDLELRVGYVFHAGDGNLHPLILIDNPNDAELMNRVHEAGRRTVELCVEYNGSITGEHGVGIEKRALMPLMYSPDELDVMREIKTLFDPHNLFNPGKIIPPPSEPLRRIPTAVPDPGVIAAHVAPSNVEEAAAILHAHTAAGRTVRIQGAGAPAIDLPATDLTMSTERLRGILTYARDDLYVTVAAGTALSDVQIALAGDGMFVPLVSPWPDTTIGGVVVTALNAPLRMRYGGVRDLVLATTVALPDGRVIRAGRPVVKNVAGYDMPKLFVGSHGTLGLLADVTLKIVPQPRARQTLAFKAATHARAAQIAAALVPICLHASALVLYAAESDFMVGFTVEGTPEEIAVELQEAEAAGRAAGARAIETGSSDGTALWAAWLATHPNARRLGLPNGALLAVLDTLDSAGVLERAAWFVDAAAGHIYLDGAPDSALQQIAAERGGYLAAMAGSAAQHFFQPSAAGLMKRVQRHFGAGGNLNPGIFAFAEE